jgi:hypothetical protein
MLRHDRPLSEVEFVAFDLETTGLFPVADRIVEFGALRFRLDGRELGTWEQLVDPECLTPPVVAQHGQPGHPCGTGHVRVGTGNGRRAVATGVTRRQLVDLPF